MNLNKTFLIGRVTKPIDSKSLPSGITIANISLATSRTWLQDGQKKEESTFHNLVAFGKQAQTLAQYVQKGQLLYVEARLTNRSWEKDGVKQYRTELIVENFQFGPKASSASSSGAASPQQSEEPDPVDYPDEDPIEGGKATSLDDF